MGNSYFENDEYRIEQGILTKYLGDKKKISIAPRVAGYLICSIGSRAFISKNVELIIIREGIEEVENDAFKDCKVQSITLPASLKNIGTNLFSYSLPAFIVVSRIMSKDKWNRLKSKCIETTENSFIYTETKTEDEILNKLFEMYILRGLLASCITPEMMTIFSDSEVRENIVFSSKKIKTEKFMTEYLIRNKICSSVSEEVDNADDYNYRNTGVNNPRRVVICKIYQDNSFVDQDNVLVKFNFIAGIYYWVRIEEVHFDKKIYFVSSREYLCSNEKFPYMKSVVGVYDEDGFGVNEKMRDFVLKKYNLLRSIP